MLAIAERVSQAACAPWVDAALAQLHEALGDDATGPDGARYDEDLFFDESSMVTAFVPVLDGWSGEKSRRAEVIELPSVDLAVLAHEGAFDELDRTYAALGTWVNAEGIAAAGPIRETYFSETEAEVAWPVTSPG